MSVSSMSQRNYLRWSKCPFCRYGDVEAAEENYYNQVHVVAMWCPKCRGEWQEEYELVRYTIDR